MERYNLRCRLSGLAEETFGNGVFWRKNKHPAFLRKFSFAVTPPRGLGDGIETGECPIDDRKVNIHPRLNELGGNHPAGQSGFEAVFDFRQAGAAVLRAEPGAEMVVSRVFPKQPVEGRGVPFGIYDAEHPFFIKQL